MTSRMLFPLAGLTLLAVATALSPSPVLAADVGACNEKACEQFGGYDMCWEQSGGPHTNCWEVGDTCKWDTCAL
jgi:hypothetical protein